MSLLDSIVDLAKGILTTGELIKQLQQSLNRVLDEMNRLRAENKDLAVRLARLEERMKDR